MSDQHPIRSFWQYLKKPLPGTRERQPPVIVEGRISRKTVGAVGAVLMRCVVAGIAAEMADWWQPPRINPFKPYFAWANSVMCQTGWGGYSQGMLALAAAVAVSGLLPIWLLWGWVWYTAHQLVRHQTNMPKSGKPWFPLQLLEGPAAVRRGRYMQIVAGLMTIPLLWITCVLFPDVLQLFLVSPSGLKVC